MRMRIALLGDIAFLGQYSLEYNPNVVDNLAIISNYLSGFDYVIGNLETPFSEKKETYGAKSAYICSNPTNVNLLKKLHIKALSLANNHMFDYGKEGYETTKKILDEIGIKWFGSEGKELKVELNGCKILLGGFCCYTSNPLRCVNYGDYGVNAYNIENARNFIMRSAAEGSIPVLAVHAGLEHVNYPSVDHIRAARLLADTNNYVYYGHHPHVIQGVEEYNGSLIAHSLGNFCFDDVYTSVSRTIPLIKLTDNNRTGMILELTIDGNNMVEWKEQAIYIGENGKISLIEADETFKEYNEAVAFCENDAIDYSARRNAILESRMGERKAQRNVIWYLKRFRPRYVRLILDMRRNQKLYNENVKRFL